MTWHSISSNEILIKLQTSKDGLDDKRVKERQTTYGPNTIAIKKKISPLKIFINQFKNLLVALLIFAAFISLAVGYFNPEKADYIDAILIFAIVIANAIFGFVQEYKAERTMEELGKMSAPMATVIRNGKEKEIDSKEVVPGDILVLREGDKVAADARIIEAYSLYADESMLTGESMATEKSPGAVEENIPLAERTNMIYMNSVLTRGRGLAVVVETGLKTEVGAIAKEISDAPEKITRFQIEIEDIGKKISIITLAILIVIIITEFLIRTGDILFIFIAAVALGVAAIPEGLPAVVTLALSIATNRMLKQNALMRRLSTVQDLGSVDIICTDKTGTLTENAMTVRHIYLDGKIYEITGTGFEKKGQIKPMNDGEINDLDLLFKCAILCNDAKETEEGFKGDPTEIAILIPAYKAGLDVEKIRKKFRRINEVPFASERKMMTTINNDGTNDYAFVKGALESVLECCTHIQEGKKITKLTNAAKEQLTERNKKMASNAMRVLAFAYKENPKSHKESDAESKLVFLGLMGMIDPPREGVKQAIKDCTDAGIRVIMVTGDNKYTAEAIGKELGFRGDAITGNELDKMSEEKLAEIVEKTNIYARTSPHHKVLLLKALQKNNHIVCMTGDGVNDAGAIKNSEVGIAMGIRGTEVTKQASDIIILDDNFITIRNAIAEGRGSFDNIRKFVTLLLGANASEVLAVFIASISFLGLSPKIAAQLLWINLLTDGLPALALGADSPAKDILKRKPRPKSERVLNKNALYFIVWMGIMEAIIALVIYAYYFMNNDLMRAYTMFFTAFVVMENISVYLVRWRYKTPLFTNKWLHLAIAGSFILQLGIIYSDVGIWFGVIPLDLIDWGIIATGALALIGIIVFAVKIEDKIMIDTNSRIKKRG